MSTREEVDQEIQALLEALADELQQSIAQACDQGTEEKGLFALKNAQPQREGPSPHGTSPNPAQGEAGVILEHRRDPFAAVRRQAQPATKPNPPCRAGPQPANTNPTSAWLSLVERCSSDATEVEGSILFAPTGGGHCRCRCERRNPLIDRRFARTVHARCIGGHVYWSSPALCGIRLSNSGLIAQHW